MTPGLESLLSKADKIGYWRLQRWQEGYVCSVNSMDENVPPAFGLTPESAVEKALKDYRRRNG